MSRECGLRRRIVATPAVWIARFVASTPQASTDDSLGSPCLPAAAPASGFCADRPAARGRSQLRLDQYRDGHEPAVAGDVRDRRIPRDDRRAPRPLCPGIERRRHRARSGGRHTRGRLRPRRRDAVAGTAGDGRAVPRSRRASDAFRLQPQQQRGGWLPRRRARAYGARATHGRGRQRGGCAHGLLAHGSTLQPRDHDHLHETGDLQPLQPVGTRRAWT